MTLQLSYAIHRFMHPRTPLSSKKLAAGWLLFTIRTAVTVAGFSSSVILPQPSKFISSPSALFSGPLSNKHTGRAAASYNKMTTALSSSKTSTSSSSSTATTVALLDHSPVKQWSDIFTQPTPNTNYNYSPHSLFPPLSSISHKGSHGRIAILGGSNKYTGAPYYAAQAALNCGVDLATVFCADEATVPIKCYSPELMVQGVYSIEQFDELVKEEEVLMEELEKYKHKNDLITVENYHDGEEDRASHRISLDKLLLEHDDSHNELIQNELLKNVDDTKKMDEIVSKLEKVKQLQEALQELQDRQSEIIRKSVQDVVAMFPTLHALCVGPGLGRHPLVFKVVEQVLTSGIEANLTLVLDADALFMLSLGEYRVLYEELLLYEKCIMTPNVMEMKRLPPLSSFDESYNKNIIVEKGHVDTLSRGGCVMQCAEEGGLKRSGGIGDVLAGTISAYMAWYSILETGHEGIIEQDLKQQRLFAVWTACCTVKRATKAAFKNKRRAMSSRDVLDEICGVIAVFEEDIENRDANTTK